MDLRLPEMNGIEATRLIREEFPNARIAMLTTYSGDVQALRALKVAAMGYVLKDAEHFAVMIATKGGHIA